MKYLAFLITALTLVSLALLLTIGIRLDVLLGDIMTLYLGAVAIAVAAFVVALVMLIRSMKGTKGDKNSFVPPSVNSSNNF